MQESDRVLASAAKKLRNGVFTQEEYDTIVAAHATHNETATKTAYSGAPGLVSRRLALFAGSMNAGNAPPPADLSEWIPTSGGNFDIIAIGLQEASYTVDDPNDQNAKKKKSSRRRSVSAAFASVGAIAFAATGVGAIALGAAAATGAALYGVKKYKHSKDHFIKRCGPLTDS